MELVRNVSRETFSADSANEAIEIIGTIGPQLVVLDYNSSPSDSLELLKRAREGSVDVPIVVVSNNSDGFIDGSSRFMQLGAYGCLESSEDHARLEQIINRLAGNIGPSDAAKGRDYFFAADYAASVSMVGRSKAMRETLKTIELVAASRCNPVLILGETGTGKELVAKAVHILRHPNEQFIAVNCAALTASLLESELFGHVKGAFTSADREKTGLFELAGTGTIFLDEISEMPLDLQAKLLRVLQEKTFRKVGGTKDITCKATIITSSNRNLKQQIEENRFRRDLYYRLNICPITIAPLRSPDRREDIELLAEFFLKSSTISPEKVDKLTSLTQLAVETLKKHSWPGNVRELRNIIERAILLETTGKIGLSSIVIDHPEYDGLCGNTSTSGGIHLPDFSLVKAERELITRALRETGWQKTRAASLLGITRATLYAKVKQYNIDKDCSQTAVNDWRSDAADSQDEGTRCESAESVSVA
jgi:DNA-binding NtrC family response regulator